MFLIICWTSSANPDRLECHGQKKETGEKKEVKKREAFIRNTSTLQPVGSQ